MSELPPDFDPARLSANLAALAERQPKLAMRLTWPVAADHVRPGGDGELLVRFRRAWRRLDLTGEECAGVLRRRATAGESAPGILFGVGRGELIEQALLERPTGPWIAWDRDPYFLRLALGRLDLAEPLRRGGLELALGCDLIPLARARARSDDWVQEQSFELRAHPLLGAIYERELSLLERGAVGQIALLAEGELFVDQVGRALARRGYVPYTIDLRGLSLEELEHTARSSGARLLMAINYTHGLAEFCAANGLRMICWEVDPATDELRPLECDPSEAHVFTYRRAHVQTFRAAGFEKVAYQPLAADVLARRPWSPEPGDRAEYAAPVSFVGASMVERGRELLGELVSAAEGLGLFDCRTRLDAVLAAQRERAHSWMLPELLKEYLPDLLAALDEHGAGSLAQVALAEVAAAEKRLGHVSALAPLGIQVWGDSGWEALVAHGVRWRGGAGHRDELGRIYSCSDVNLDVGRLYQDDIVTMRVFDVLACGGFCLTQRNPEVEALFDVGAELDVYSTREELVQKTSAWLADPQRRREVALRGLEAVRERHALDLRLDAMLTQSMVA